MNQQCIERPELESFLRGKIPETLAEQISSHVDECEVCQDTVVALSGSEDTFVDGLKIGNADAGVEKENAFRHGLQRLLSGMQSLAPAAEDPPTPSRIGPYLIEEPLGAGGMGCVFRAQHPKLKRTVALKVLPAHRWSNATAIARFEREMEAIGALDHPHIVRASDAGEDQGMHYLVMEYVDGLDLARLAKRVGPLPVADACELIRQAAIGLQHAHDNRLVHRDVKPSNLMLAWERGSGISSETKPSLKILDLGLALLGDEHLREGNDMTTVGALMGTLDYMSPEQGIDSHAVDHRADIYGLGATMFKLLTGRAPYADPKYSTLMKKMTALATKAAPSVGAIRPDLPSEVIDVVDRMLARDPDERFSSARDVAQALTEPAKDATLSALLKHGLETEEPADDAPTATVAKLHSAMAAQRPPVPSPKASGGGVTKWLVALAGGFLFAAAGIAFWITTDNGLIHVTSADPNAKVVIKKGERTVDTIELKQGKGQTQIRSGDYVIEIEGDSTGLSIQPSKVAVRRNGEVGVNIARAVKVPAESLSVAGNLGDALIDELQKVTPDVASNETSRVAWTPFSSARFELARSKGKRIFVYFGADWSPHSIAHKEEISRSRILQEAFNKNYFEMLYADVSEEGAAARKYLAKWGGEPQSVPFIAIFDPKVESPIALNGALSPWTLLEQLAKSGSTVPDPRTTSGKALEDSELEIRIDGPEPAVVAVGDTAKFTIEFKNIGEATLRDVSIECQGDENFIPTSATPGCTQNGAKLTWAADPILPHSYTTIEVECCVPPVVASESAKLQVRLTSNKGIGEKQFEVKLAPPFDEEESTNFAESTTPKAPRYNGRTLRQWLDELEFERNPDRVKDAMKAIATMIKDADESMVNESVEAIFGLMRRYGKNSKMIGTDTWFCERAWLTLVNQPLDKTVHRAILEITEGNAKSRQFLFYFLQPTIGAIAVNSQKPLKDTEKLRELLGKRSSEVVAAARKVSAEDQDWAIEFLFQLGHQTKTDFSQLEGTKELFTAGLAAKNHKIAAMAAWQLAKIAPKTKELVPRLEQILRKPITEPREQWELLPAKFLALQAVAQLGQDAENLIPLLSELLESDWISAPMHSWGFPGPLPNLPQQGGGMANVYVPLLVRTLTKFGRKAKPAIPGLLSLVRKTNGFGGYGGGYGGGGGGGVGTGPTQGQVEKIKEYLLKLEPDLKDPIATVSYPGMKGLDMFDMWGRERKDGREDFDKESVPFSIFSGGASGGRLMRPLHAAFFLRGAQQGIGQQLIIDVNKLTEDGRAYRIVSRKGDYEILFPLLDSVTAEGLHACLSELAPRLATKVNSDERLVIDLRPIAAKFKKPESTTGGFGGGMGGGGMGGMQ